MFLVIGVVKLQKKTAAECLRQSLGFESEFGGLKRVLSFKIGFEGDLEVQNTFSGITEFVSRHYAAFSAPTIFRDDLEVRFTFSHIRDFVKRSEKGSELCRTLLEINPRTNIVYLTAYIEYSFDAWSTGASGFTLKPITAEGIRAQLKKNSAIRFLFFLVRLDNDIDAADNLGIMRRKLAKE